MNRRALGALALLLAAAGAAADGPDGKQPGHIVPGWYEGLPVIMRAYPQGESKPVTREAQVPEDTPQPQSVVYIVGVVDRAIGASPHRKMPGPGGKTLIMPGHQGVLACLHSPEKPGMGVPYAVVPGPAANKHNLRTDTVPGPSLIGAPLATEIKIGPAWIALKGVTPIEWGLAKGILRLRFFGGTPVGWSTPDWSSGYPPMPAMTGECQAPARPPRAYMAADQGPEIPAE